MILLKTIRPKKTVKATVIGLLAVILLAFLFPSESNFISGKVVGVHDGDTITLLTENNDNIRIRLAQVDAPEKNQPFGNNSKQMLSDLIYLKDIRVREEDIDRYGRSIGTIFLSETDINALMVQQGGAWVYKQYAYDTYLNELEQEAKDQKRGLWSLPQKDHIPPWEWRKGKRIYNEKGSKTMNFKATFCDPLNPDIIQLGKIKPNEIITLFEKTSWKEYLQKMNTAKEGEIHFSPSLEVENNDNKNGIVISAVGDPEKYEFYVFYKRPKKVKVLFGFKEKIDMNYTTEITGQSKEDVISILNALKQNDMAYLDDKIGK